MYKVAFFLIFFLLFVILISQLKDEKIYLKPIVTFVKDALLVKAINLIDFYENNLDTTLLIGLVLYCEDEIIYKDKLYNIIYIYKDICINIHILILIDIDMIDISLDR